MPFVPAAIDTAAPTATANSRYRVPRAEPPSVCPVSVPVWMVSSPAVVSAM